jgi:predicted RNA-binding protein with PIN domain
MGHEILIDGYNMIKSNIMFKMLEIKNLALARDVLIRQIKNRYRKSMYRVSVVFDGSDVREQISHDEHIRIIFSRSGETADRVIARLAEEARAQGHEVIVYSDDGEVQQSVVKQGGSQQSTHALAKRLNAAPYDMEARVRHRQEIKRAYGIDPTAKWKEDEEITPLSQRKKGRKSRRNR